MPIVQQIQKRMLIDKSQAHIWTEEWQEKLSQSREALEKGEYKVFDNMEDLIKDLEELAANTNTHKD